MKKNTQTQSQQASWNTNIAHFDGYTHTHTSSRTFEKWLNQIAQYIYRFSQLKVTFDRPSGSLFCEHNFRWMWVTLKTFLACILVFSQVIVKYSFVFVTMTLPRYLKWRTLCALHIFFVILSSFWSILHARACSLVPTARMATVRSVCCQFELSKINRIILRHIYFPCNKRPFVAHKWHRQQLKRKQKLNDLLVCTNIAKVD